MNFRLSEVKILKKKFALRVLLFAFCALFTACGSVPNLEPPECVQARENVKKLYSYRFDNNPKPAPENLKLYEKYLSKELFQKLSTSTETNIDYFTQTDDYPKAFRIGGCQVVSPDKTSFEVLLFWRDENRIEEQKVKVEAIKTVDNWLVNKVEK